MTLHTIREIREWARCCAQIHLARRALGVTHFEQIDVATENRDVTLYCYPPGSDTPITSGYEAAMPLDEAAVQRLKNILMKKPEHTF